MTTPLQWLVPFDGSDHSVRALELAIQEAKARHDAPKLLLLNVQLPLSGDITRFIDRNTVNDFHREAGEKMLDAAKPPLESCGLEYAQHILVGPVASTIVEFAESKGCSMIVMGAHGHGGVSGLLMGSVATKVLHQTRLPVLLIK
ncbi:MAG TPA: universal stress protein [Rhodoferax sp.]|jgi:nucleotide-binding universal stress UspA family protein|nr:universal stress protein [Rhodoferax sp.]HPW27777.1 universal stress protein [Rhodoferax sp.]